MNIFDLLDQLIQLKGSDLHIVEGSAPYFRVDGELVPVENGPVLTVDSTRTLIEPLLNEEQKEYVEVNKELDLGYQYQEKGRFRINVYHTRGMLAAALRLVPAEILTVEELNLPQEVHRFAQHKQGFILVTGPTGEGKSTTLASVISEINKTRAEHILTIEDPIEYVHKPIKSIVSQREMNQDTKDWSVALRSALRADPDVVMVGEMRDYETIAAAITVAETGHLVFATLHTGSASQTMDRIIDVFPAEQQGQIRQQLASTIIAVASQRLLPRLSGGRIPAVELMFANDAVRNLIREGKTYQIDNVMQTSGSQGMILMENSLARLVQQGQISKEIAVRQAFRPNEMARLIGNY
jgi:twitching motility protein PilT